MLNKNLPKIFGMRTPNLLAPNVFAALRGSGFQALPYELPACKSSKYFQTKVMPLSRKTARWAKVIFTLFILFSLLSASKFFSQCEKIYPSR
jgi:hypothetical protein